ncbi:MAG TPA: hypothetical protein PLI45_04435 [Candidatus Woesebacteria bacterium]|nr:hypothetical protein [Candidatus Woesebacteria bacterium]
MPLSFKINLNFFRHPLSPQVLKKKLQSREFQLEISQWVDSTLRPLEDRQKYLDLCKQDSNFVPEPKTLKNIFHHLHQYAVLGKPGHDLGHLYRDLLSGAAMAGTDPYAAKAYPCDLTAAFFSAAYHDIGTGIWPRYQDYFWECGHAEIGAWLFYNLSVSYLPEHIRRLAAYAIAAHTHQLKPVETKNGYTRQPWVDHLFEDDGHPVGVSIWITRFSDRLDTNGVTLFCRHIIANVEGSRQEGRDFTGDSWYELNKESLSFLFKPDTIISENNMPSTLKHMENFALSAKRLTPYSQHDDRFPVMKKLITYKINQTETMIDIVRHQTGKPDFPRFRRFVTRMSLSPVIKSTLNDVEKLWDVLTPEEQSHWAKGFTYAEENYPEWLDMLHQKIRQSDSPVLKFSRGLITDIIDDIS